MQVWFYHREAEVGDYVYADGSYSNLLNKHKTCIGVCFYIDQADKSRRLMVSVTELGATDWGLAGLNNTNSITGITLDDSPSYDVYDTPLNNITNATPTPVNDANYRDDASPDGFKIQDLNTASGQLGFTQLSADLECHGKRYAQGSFVPLGLYNTLTVINHRDKVLKDSAINLPVPVTTEGETERQCLDRLVNELISRNGGADKYGQYYWRAFSFCHAYEPSVSEDMALDDRFKAGNWFLPASGDLCRIYWYYADGLKAEPTLPIFKDKIAEGTMTKFMTSEYYSSTEMSAPDAIKINFDGGRMYTGASGSNRKWNKIYIRPVCAF